MTNEELYGEKYKEILDAQKNFNNTLLKLKENNENHIMYITTRIKSADSMLEKLARRNVEQKDMFSDIYDIVGFRIICPFRSDVYYVIDLIKNLKNIEIIQEKDYMSHPKPNGYQSYHIIVKPENSMVIEIQIRTMALDFWAALEHQIKYKKDIENEEIITKELKRIMQNILSLDMDMEALKELAASLEKR